MDTNVSSRFSRSWNFFSANVGGLMIGTLLVILCACLIVPIPWMSMNLLGEILDAMEGNRPVRWQAVYERKGTFLASWGLLIVVGFATAVGYMLCILPGVMLSLYWMYATPLVARGRPVFSALGESGTLLQSRGGWGNFLVSWLVMLGINILGSFVPFGFLVATPMSLIYLSTCYLEDSGSVVATGPLSPAM